MLSTSSSNNLSQPNSQKIQKSTEEDRMLELKVAEQSIDFSNKNFSREIYIYHKKQEKFKNTVMGVHTIVSKKLYRLSDLTLEEYFRNRWKISRAQVYRFLDAAEVLKQLEDFTFLPSHELLCRTLKQHAKCTEHIKILWKTVLNKVDDHLTSINSSLISNTWLELVKQGVVIPLPAQPKKTKKRSRKNDDFNDGSNSGENSNFKVIKIKHPNMNNDENKLAYNLLEYNENQINSNIKTNNSLRRSNRYDVMKSNHHSNNNYSMNNNNHNNQSKDKSRQFHSYEPLQSNASYNYNQSSSSSSSNNKYNNYSNDSLNPNYNINHEPPTSNYNNYPYYSSDANSNESIPPRPYYSANEYNEYPFNNNRNNNNNRYNNDRNNNNNNNDNTKEELYKYHINSSNTLTENNTNPGSTPYFNNNDDGNNSIYNNSDNKVYPPSSIESINRRLPDINSLKNDILKKEDNDKNQNNYLNYPRNSQNDTSIYGINNEGGSNPSSSLMNKVSQTQNRNNLYHPIEPTSPNSNLPYNERYNYDRKNDLYKYRTNIVDDMKLMYDSSNNSKKLKPTKPDLYNKNNISEKYPFYQSSTSSSLPMPSSLSPNSKQQQSILNDIPLKIDHNNKPPPPSFDRNKNDYGYSSNSYPHLSPPPNRYNENPKINNMKEFNNQNIKNFDNSNYSKIPYSETTKYDIKNKKITENYLTNTISTQPQSSLSYYSNQHLPFENTSRDSYNIDDILSTSKKNNMLPVLPPLSALQKENNNNKSIAINNNINNNSNNNSFYDYERDNHNIDSNNNINIIKNETKDYDRSFLFSNNLNQQNNDNHKDKLKNKDIKSENQYNPYNTTNTHYSN
jgi:hypothetical protein